METFLYTIEEAGDRLDIFLAGRLDDCSRSYVQKLIEEGRVLVGSKSVKANYRLRKGDSVQVSLPPPSPLEILPEPIPLDIVFEDRELIVVNKPQGMVVHPAPGHSNHTLVNALLHHCQGNLSGINGYLRPGIVHRIDRDTSGLLVAAKTNSAHQALASQLAGHEMTRRYEAVTIRPFQRSESAVIKSSQDSDLRGMVDKAISRHPTDRKKMWVTDKGGRRAVTHFRVLENLPGYSHIEAQLETGRTHQIRVHMAYLGHPLLGDPVYGGLRPGFHLNGQTLHARVLGFVHPATGTYMEFNSELPDYFFKLLNQLNPFPLGQPLSPP